MYFLVRVILCVSVPIGRATLKFDPHFVQGFILSVSALLNALSRPYNKTYMNVVDSSYLVIAHKYIVLLDSVYGCLATDTDRHYCIFFDGS